MAVMNSLLQEEGAVEQKAQPIPSSDEMALDLTVNGSLKNDETAPYTNGSSKIPTPSLDGTNEAGNMDAFATNNSAGGDLDLFEDTANVAESTDEKVAINNNPQSDLADASVSSTVAVATDDKQALDLNSHSVAADEQQLDATSDLPPAPTTVLPLIEAQESDLRDVVVPATAEQVDETRTEKHDLDLLADSNLATGADSAQSTIIDSLDKSGLLTPSEDRPPGTEIASNLDLTSRALTEPDVNMAENAESAQADVEMSDAPRSPSKIAREREEDLDEEPSAKRAKVEEGADAEPKFAIPDAPVPSGSEPPPTTQSDDAPPTEYQLKEILKAVRQWKSTTNGRSFKASVASLWPTLAAAYAEKVSNPIDLSIIDQRIKDKHYPSIADIKADFNLIYENAVLFNGAENPVTKQAQITRDHLLSKIPAPEPTKQEKKPKRVPPPPESRATPARRQSRGAAASSPPLAASGPTFALDPSGTPLIRRDSTKTGDGGRPKREIHPPKSKDLVYSARPKKKKFATELKFCDEVLNEIKKPKYTENGPFLAPVDPVALGIPDYFKIIKNPMDLQTVTTRLHSGQYESAKEFENDMRLILKNCFKFNPEGSPVNDIGKKFEILFENEWAKKARYIADHTSNAASPSSTLDTDDEESEEEEVVEEPASDASAALALRLIEEQNKLIEMMGSKNANSVVIQMQSDMVALIKKQIDTENAKQVKKTKPAKQSKKAATKKKTDTKKGYRPKHIGQVEKEQISSGIVALTGKDMDQAVVLLKVDFPNLNLDEELELDIDQFSPITLSKLHDLIARTHPEIVRPAAPAPSRASKPAKPKKNKPMSKREQEAKIEQLKSLTEKFERQGSTSDNGPVVPSVEQDNSSGDEESSDSEED